MKDAEGVSLLQWCMPKLRLRWPGLRKVRRIVYKRIDRRLKELGLSGVDAYRSYLESHPAEWPVLDALCWIPVSRFYRDKGVFQHLEQEVLYQLSEAAAIRGEKEVWCWSLGCASGEEPYTLAILWRHVLASRFPMVEIRILATDVDPQAIERASRGCYPEHSIRDLPQDWRAEAFVVTNEEFCLKAEYRQPVIFRLQDIRETTPEGRFDLILCRNVVFTYFDSALQLEILQKILDKLISGGALVIGRTEYLPEGVAGLELWSKATRVYRKCYKIEEGFR